MAEASCLFGREPFGSRVRQQAAMQRKGGNEKGAHELVGAPLGGGLGHGEGPGRGFLRAILTQEPGVARECGGGIEHHMAQLMRGGAQFEIGAMAQQRPVDRDIRGSGHLAIDFADAVDLPAVGVMYAVLEIPGDVDHPAVDCEAREQPDKIGGLERLLGIGGKRLLSQAVGERPDLRGANRPLDAGVEIEGWDHGCLRGVVCYLFTICSSQQKSPEGDFGGGE